MHNQTHEYAHFVCRTLASSRRCALRYTHGVRVQKVSFILGLLAMLLSASAAAKQTCEGEVPLKSVTPAYPLLESPVGHSGRVVVEFIIDYKGEVVSPRVVEAESQPTVRFAEPFAKSATVALKQWKFEPRQIACESTQTFVFELTE